MKVYKNADEVNAAIRNQLQGKEREDFEQGLKLLDPGSELRAAFKKLCPDKNEKELDILVNPNKYR